MLEYNMNIHKIRMTSPNLGRVNVTYFFITQKGIMGPSQIFYHIEVSDRTRRLNFIRENDVLEIVIINDNLCYWI